MNVNGFDCCGRNWGSSWCYHSCGRSVNHKDHCRCGWCGNTNPESHNDEYEDDYLVTDGTYSYRRQNLSELEKSRLYVESEELNKSIFDLEEDFQSILELLKIIYNLDRKTFDDIYESYKKEKQDIESIVKTLKLK